MGWHTISPFAGISSSSTMHTFMKKLLLKKLTTNVCPLLNSPNPEKSKGHFHPRALVDESGDQITLY